MQPSFLERYPIRIDPLTGIGNLLSFADFLLRHTAADRRKPLSLLILDINGFARFDRKQGDDILRWVACAMLDRGLRQTYRISGDEFVVIYADTSAQDAEASADQLAEHLDHEAAGFGIDPPVATMAVVHYPADAPFSPADVLGNLQTALAEARFNADSPVTRLKSTTLPPPRDLRRLVNDMLDRLVTLGAILEESQELAYTDPVTGVPNLRAAHQVLESALEAALAKQQPFALVLLDGDNLRRYNQVNYAAGDKMIQDLCATLREQLRPADFLARWRVGDEFLVLLPQTSREGAAAVAERLRLAVERTSESWLFPISISLGVAIFPQNGTAKQDLLLAVEQAKDQAKSLGKNCVVVAGDAPRDH